jgi:hypothetical protein
LTQILCEPFPLFCMVQYVYLTRCLELIESLELPKVGRLAKNPTGLVFLQLEDQWISGLQPELRHLLTLVATLWKNFGGGGGRDCLCETGGYFQTGGLCHTGVLCQTSKPLSHLCQLPDWWSLPDLWLQPDWWPRSDWWPLSD